MASPPAPISVPPSRSSYSLALFKPRSRGDDLAQSSPVSSSPPHTQRARWKHGNGAEGPSEALDTAAAANLDVPGVATPISSTFEPTSPSSSALQHPTRLPKWLSRSSVPAASSSTSHSTSNAAVQLPSPVKTRTTRSRSIGSLNLMAGVLQSKSRPTTPPTQSPQTPSQPSFPASTSHLPGTANGRPPSPQDLRRGSVASTGSSHSSLRGFGNLSLKPSRHGKARRERQGTDEVLEEWANADLEDGDEEARIISEEMVRASSSGSGSASLNGRSAASAGASAEGAVVGAAAGGQGVGAGKGGKFSNSLRRTKSKLGLFGKGKEQAAMGNGAGGGLGSLPAGGAADDADDPEGMVQSPVMTFVEPPSPDETRSFYSVKGPAVTGSHGSASFLDLFGSSSTPTSSTFPSNHPSASPGSTANGNPNVAGRIGGWFSSMLHSSASSMHLPLPADPASPQSSPEKGRSRGAKVSGSPSSSSIRLASPTKKGSSTSISGVGTGGGGSGVAGGGGGGSGGRLGPLDRMLDKAVQYFLDTDSQADRCEDEIWVLGVRHPGWQPQPASSTTPSTPGEGEEEGEGGEEGEWRGKRRNNMVASGKRTWSSPVKSRRAAPPSLPSPQADDPPPTPTNDPFIVSPTPTSSSIGLGPSSSPAPTPTAVNGWPSDFYHDFYSRVALTYRSGFPLIPCSSSSPGGGGGGAMHGVLNTLSLSIGRGANRGREEGGLSSDTGWGCMLRTGQSLLANALVVVHLGRDWRRPLPLPPLPPASAHGHPAPAVPPPASPHSPATYARILSLFLDDPSPLAPFSVHRFALTGKHLGKHVGEWFGPSTAAGAIKALVNEYEPAGVRVVSCVDGTVYESEVAAASQGWQGKEGTRWSTPVLVLINLRLGIDGVNPIYHNAIKGIFRFPQSVGIAGGRPSSSYYFVGAQANSLFYIDPHHPRPAVPLVHPPEELFIAAQEVPLGPAKERREASKSSAIEGNVTDSFVTVTAGPSPSSSAASRDSSPVTQQLDAFFLSSYPDAAWRTYHCDKVRKCALSSLDPSMLLGFLIKDEGDWDDFKMRVRELGQASSPIFSIAASPPAWMRRASSASGLHSNNNTTNGPATPSSARTAPPHAAANADDSFSDVGEEDAAESSDDGFSEPDDWELDSTDASGASSSATNASAVAVAVAVSVAANENENENEGEDEDEWEHDAAASVREVDDDAEMRVVRPGPRPAGAHVEAPSPRALQALEVVEPAEEGVEDDALVVVVEQGPAPGLAAARAIDGLRSVEADEGWHGVERGE
ncbi:hypothetical protein JCM5296_001943 [Sporobolomyces johnsonii]